MQRRPDADRSKSRLTTWPSFQSPAADRRADALITDPATIVVPGARAALTVTAVEIAATVVPQAGHVNHVRGQFAYS